MESYRAKNLSSTQGNIGKHIKVLLYFPCTSFVQRVVVCALLILMDKKRTFRKKRGGQTVMKYNTLLENVRSQRKILPKFVCSTFLLVDIQVYSIYFQPAATEKELVKKLQL